jgi:glycosyltransferase involved in cell wall biosynthesis
VILPGYVYGRLLEELYSNAAAFVLPSLLEGLPLTLLEAASYGTPIIASDIPPHVEILGGDGPGRRLVVAGDQTSLVATLGATLRDLEGERAGAERVSTDVVAAHRWDDAVAATEEVYRSVLTKPRAGPPPREDRA